MKYWIYKDSRILGPFDKNSVAGLPGVDSSTLVCVGDDAAAGEGDWRPAGDLPDLAALPLDRGAIWPDGDVPSTIGLLDKLQIEAAGLIGDDAYPGAAEDLFQDADMKRTFGEMLAPKPSVDEAELRRAKERAVELTAQLELLYQRVAELETGQTNLVHRLAEKELQLRARAGVVPSPAVELLNKRLAELEAAQAALLHRLAEKEAAGRVEPAARVAPPARVDPAAPALVEPAAAAPVVTTTPILAPLPAVAPVAQAPVVKLSTPAAPPETVLPPLPRAETLFSAPAPIPPLPVLPDAPSASTPAPAESPVSTPPPVPAPVVAEIPAERAPLLPPMPVFAPAAEAPAAASPFLEASSAPPAAEPPVFESAPPKAAFETKTFKPVPTVKSFPVAGDNPPAAKKEPFESKTFRVVPMPKAFRVVDTEEEESETPAASPKPAMEPAPAAKAPESAPAAKAFEWGAAPASIPSLEPPPAAPAPAAAPPLTLSFGTAPQPEPASMPTFSDPGRSFSPAASAEPPGFAPDNPFAPGRPFSGSGPAEDATVAAFPTPAKSGDDMAGAPSSQEALARLAKPAPAPATQAPRAPRSNKKFLIGAAVLIVVMAVVGSLFLRHSKDLKQMANLDDGRAPVGGETADEAARPPLVKPKMAAPPADNSAPPAPAAPVVPAAPAASGAPQSADAGRAPVAEAPQAASSANIDAAVAAVKNFPLDGERGTVAQWLQFSYSAAPDAGRESWSASETADKTYLVEYRFTPTRGDEVHYLFDVDMDRGFVIGKNADAKSVLAGGAPAPEKARAKKRKTAPRRKKAAKAAAAPKSVPLLPLPSEGELRPPSEDDGAFNADTVNSGSGGAPPASSPDKLDAAVAAVKEFPLDGDRGSVGTWLRTKHAADEGRESWTARLTGDKTYLVEYRFAPASGAAEVSCLFEADMARGFVIGQNPAAKSVLSGSAR
ncbi:MAG: hypothetical protein ACHQ49_06275 [Elusimicrobiota bacterium]